MHRRTNLNFVVCSCYNHFIVMLSWCPGEYAVHMFKFVTVLRIQTSCTDNEMLVSYF